MILSCSQINKSFGDKCILSNTTFHVNEHEKAAIVGMNGAGKTTLLRIIMHEISSDSGDVILAKGSTIGYLPQLQNFSSENSIYDELMTVKEDLTQLNQQIRQLEINMKSMAGNELNKALSKYSQMTHEFESKNGYAIQSEITGVLKGLGFSEDDFSKDINTLSGGQKTRVALGKLLLSSPDILLMDEPTNHLDMQSISWLENYLLNYKGAVLIVSHDRYFLDKIVLKVIELDRTHVQMFQGNYSEYAEKKEALRENEIKAYLNQQQEIKHQEEVITKLRSFNREKSIKRAESREKMLDKIDRLEKPVSDDAKISMRLEPDILSGNDVLTVTDLSKSFGSLELFRQIHFDIKRGERVAIIGGNGTGKTTILKIINDLLPVDEGECKLGAKVHLGYYDQEHHVLQMDKTIFDEIQDAYPDLDNTRVRNVLASFLFTGDDVFKRIKDLSGGERGRVSLAKLMLSEANFLILDEPTNHLDIHSKEILENALVHYTGTVLYVSHDRYFINKTATRILDLTRKHLLSYTGNYDYYMEKRDEFESRYFNNITTESSEAPSTESENKSNWQQQKQEQAKLRKLQTEFNSVENEIESLENENNEIDKELEKPEIATNVSKLMEFNKRKETINEKLEALMERWEELSEKLEGEC